MPFRLKKSTIEKVIDEQIPTLNLVNKYATKIEEDKSRGETMLVLPKIHNQNPLLMNYNDKYMTVR